MANKLSVQRTTRTVFERFYKADPARAGGGSGLGLAIAFEDVRLLGGGIDGSSKTGAGSRFPLRLPANPSEDQPDAAVKRR